MGKRSKDDLIEARRKLAAAGLTTDIDELVEKIRTGAENDPGIVALTSIISTHAAALVEYVGGRVTAQTVSSIAAAACSMPWADETTVKKVLKQAHMICRTTREKAAAVARPPSGEPC